MHTLDEFLDDTLPNLDISKSDSISVLNGDSEDSPLIPFVEAGYEGKIDYRVRQLSYSSMLTLHSCPRKFQLYRLRTTHRAEETAKSTVTFAFGHIVGEAIQLAIEGYSEQDLSLIHI